MAPREGPAASLSPVSQAPIVLFAYDRPEHLQQTLEALSANEGAAESELLVYSDGAKTPDREEAVGAVREYLRSVTGFKSVTVTERATNMGLASSVIAGVSEILGNSPSAIVMEDDLVTSKNFLAFVNAALAVYEPRADIFSVTGHNYPIDIPRSYREDAYLSYRGSSWGWGTWRDRWEKVDWAVGDYAELKQDPRAQELFARGGDDLLSMLDLQMAGELDSWSIRFDYAHSKHDAFCVHPVISKVLNIGFDGTGVHSTDGTGYVADLDPGDRPFSLRPDLAVDAAVQRAFERRFRPSRQPAPAQFSFRGAKGRLRRLARSAAR
jgi:hypothetical protein